MDLVYTGQFALRGHCVLIYVFTDTARLIFTYMQKVRKFRQRFHQKYAEQFNVNTACVFIFEEQQKEKYI